MIPFCSSTGTAVHWILIDLEVSGDIYVIVGTPSGTTAQYTNKNCPQQEKIIKLVRHGI
jgi:hypothetical protein